MLILVVEAIQRTKKRTREKKFLKFFSFCNLHHEAPSRVDPCSATAMLQEMVSRFSGCFVGMQLRCIEHVLHDCVARSFIAKDEDVEANLEMDAISIHQ